MIKKSKLSTTFKVMGMIFAFTLLVRLIAALPIQRPGYIDAYYYYDGAEALYRGLGFNEEFIWNYLDDPQGIPHPSHLYWPPLSSILAYLSFLVFRASYRAAQLPFILLSAILPLITYYVSCQVSPNRRHAIAAALFTTFSGYYTIYWASPDSFAPFAVTASLSLVAMARGLRGDSPWWFALSGPLAGLSHLTRADGVLLWVYEPVLIIGDAEEDRDKTDSYSDDFEDAKNIIDLTLPPGRAAGLILHEIFEEIGFTSFLSFNSYKDVLNDSEIEAVITNKMNRYRLDRSAKRNSHDDIALQYKNEIARIVFNTLKFPMNVSDSINEEILLPFIYCYNFFMKGWILFS